MAIQVLLRQVNKTKGDLPNFIRREKSESIHSNYCTYKRKLFKFNLQMFQTGHVPWSDLYSLWRLFRQASFLTGLR